jgi:hypothetical protein
MLGCGSVGFGADWDSAKAGVDEYAGGEGDCAGGVSSVVKIYVIVGTLGYPGYTPPLMKVFANRFGSAKSDKSEKRETE